MVMMTDSMSPTIENGDTFLVDTEYDFHNLTVGSVIVYYSGLDENEDSYELMVTSRIVDIKDTGTNRYFKTKGDNNKRDDQGWVRESAVIGVFVRVSETIEDKIENERSSSNSDEDIITF